MPFPRSYPSAPLRPEVQEAREIIAHAIDLLTSDQTLALADRIKNASAAVLSDIACTHGIGPGTLSEKVGLRGAFVCPWCHQTVTHPEPRL